MTTDIIDTAINAAKANTRGVRKPSVDTKVINFVKDGIILDRRQWFTGMELEYTPDSDVVKATKDRKGNSWLDIVDDEEAQLSRYGDVYMRPGPYRGKKFASMTAMEILALREAGHPLAPLDPADAEAADAKRRFTLGRY